MFIFDRVVWGGLGRFIRWMAVEQIDLKPLHSKRGEEDRSEAVSKSVARPQNLSS